MDKQNKRGDLFSVVFGTPIINDDGSVRSGGVLYKGIVVGKHRTIEEIVKEIIKHGWNCEKISIKPVIFEEETDGTEE
jgi:hypothetical protein